MILIELLKINLLGLLQAFGIHDAGLSFGQAYWIGMADCSVMSGIGIMLILYATWPKYSK